MIRRLGILSILCAATACWHYGFSSGGLPSGIKTVAVLPFENATSTPELQKEVTDILRDELQSRLGLRQAPESKANALVRGKIVRYEPDIPVGYSADPRRATTARRKLRLSIDVEMLDQRTGATLLKKSIVTEGEYAEGAETTGRHDALVKLATDVVEGAQSQW